MNSDRIETTEIDSRDQFIDWKMLGRIILKASILFIAINLIFAACRPLNSLGGVSLYNHLFPGRLRLPYGEVPAKDFNLTLNNLPALLASHEWGKSSSDEEYKVLLIGDSGTWGWFLRNDQSLAGQLNAMGLRTKEGRPVIVYNLGFPFMSLTKDLMLLDQALLIDKPDLILWPMTMQSFAPKRQLDHPLLQENADLVRELIQRYGLSLDSDDPRFVDRTFFEETVVGRRRELADLLRLQAWGVAWAATGKDQDIPEDIPLRKTDLDADESWLDIKEPRQLSTDDLMFDVLAAGIERAGDVPIAIVNEPIFISDGENSHIRYNTFYPRWAFDNFRQLLSDESQRSDWQYIDLWDAIPPAEFTDTPVHLTPEGTAMMADILAGEFGWGQ